VFGARWAIPYKSIVFKGCQIWHALAKNKIKTLITVEALLGMSG
jgi:hypothetical protein